MFLPGLTVTPSPLFPEKHVAWVCGLWLVWLGSQCSCLAFTCAKIPSCQRPAFLPPYGLTKGVCLSNSALATVQSRRASRDGKRSGSIFSGGDVARAGSFPMLCGWLAQCRLDWLALLRSVALSAAFAVRRSMKDQFLLNSFWQLLRCPPSGYFTEWADAGDWPILIFSSRRVAVR